MQQRGCIRDRLSGNSKKSSDGEKTAGGRPSKKARLAARPIKGNPEIGTLPARPGWAEAQGQRPGKRAGRSIQKIGRTLQLNDTGIAERSPPLAQCRQRRGGGPRKTKQKTRRELFFHRPAFSETRSAEFRRAKAETEDRGAEAPESDGPRRKTGTHGFSVHRQPTGWPQDPKVCKARFQIQREFGSGNAFRSANPTDPKSA